MLNCTTRTRHQQSQEPLCTSRQNQCPVADSLIDPLTVLSEMKVHMVHNVTWVCLRGTTKEQREGGCCFPLCVQHDKVACHTLLKKVQRPVWAVTSLVHS